MNVNREQAINAAIKELEKRPLRDYTSWRQIVEMVFDAGYKSGSGDFASALMHIGDDLLQDARGHRK